MKAIAHYRETGSFVKPVATMEKHLSSLPEYPAEWLTPEMDGKEVEVELRYQIEPDVKGQNWKDCTEKIYWQTHHSPRRIVAIPKPAEQKELLIEMMSQDDAIGLYEQPVQEETGEGERDPFIEKHLAIIREKSMDSLIHLHIERMWGGLEMASVQNFVETGKVSGSLYLALKAMLTTAYNWNPRKPSPSPQAEEMAKGLDSLRYLLNMSWENPKMQVSTILDKRFDKNKITVREQLEMLRDLLAGLSSKQDGTDELVLYLLKMSRENREHILKEYNSGKPLSGLLSEYYNQKHLNSK